MLYMSLCDMFFSTQHYVLICMLLLIAEIHLPLLMYNIHLYEYTIIYLSFLLFMSFPEKGNMEGKYSDTLHD